MRVLVAVAGVTFVDPSGRRVSRSLSRILPQLHRISHCLGPVLLPVRFLPTRGLRVRDADDGGLRPDQISGIQGDHARHSRRQRTWANPAPSRRAGGRCHHRHMHQPDLGESLGVCRTLHSLMGLTAWQVVKTRMQTQLRGAEGNYRGLLRTIEVLHASQGIRLMCLFCVWISVDGAVMLWREEGLQGFYRGWVRLCPFLDEFDVLTYGRCFSCPRY